jgi:DUF2974 family protein
MSKKCTHSEYRMSPEFTSPAFERKHVEFSATLDFYMKNIPWTYTYLGFGCDEREQEVAETFACMKYLYPAPTGWNSDGKVKSLDEKDTLESYCVKTGKAVVTYTRPERSSQDHKAILKDICEGLVIVNSYKIASRKPESDDKPISYSVMQELYDSECSDSKFGTKEKPTFCYAEHKFDNDSDQCRYFELDCASGALRKAISQKNCNTTQISPEYSVDKGSVSYHGTFARFASLSYRNNIDHLDDEWSYLGHSSNNKWGFYGHAFTSNMLQITVIVFRGTDDLTIDWFGSNFAFGLGYEPFQYKYALEYFDIVKSSHHDDHQYFVAGHSLGGGLAQLVSIARGIQAITFDAPGTMIPARNLFSQEDIDKATSLITSYIFGLNLINCAGKHLVDPVTVTEKLIEDCNKFFLMYTLSQHDMQRGAERFHSVSGKPLFEEIIPKGLLGLTYAKEHLFKQCRKEEIEIITDALNCAEIMMQTSESLKKSQVSVPSSQDIIIVTRYFPMLKFTSQCKDVSLFSSTQNNLYQIFLEGPDREGFLNTVKSNIVDQIKYVFSFPVKINQESLEWVVVNDNHIPTLDIYMLNCTIELDKDRDYFLNQIRQDNELRIKYNVIIKDSHTDDCILAGQDSSCQPEGE